MEINYLVVVRGGGDIASGIIQKLSRSGFKVVVLEVEKPSFIRRRVCYGEAIYDGEVELEGVQAKKALNPEEAKKLIAQGKVAVLIDPRGETIKDLKPRVVVDAILAKKNLGTHLEMAEITIGVGPGFCAGVNVLAVIETMRGHDLGRIIFKGYPKKNTGVPGVVAGYAKERVIYSPKTGTIKNKLDIGDIVQKGMTLASVDGIPVIATITGVLRGIIRDGYEVFEGMKIGDIDPRVEEQDNCYTISDKARNIGGGVLEGILYLKRSNQNKLNK